MKIGNLYIIATPIGNLEDITIRAIETLKTVDYIACEDTRRTGLLLKKLNITNKKMLFSFYDQTEDLRIPNILNLLNGGQDVALVSDSGTPTISDPGFRLVRACIEKGFNIISIPGPSALISALVTSGMPTDRFIFLGFLPKSEGKRLKSLKNIKNSNEKFEATVIIYEAPHRLIKTFKSIEKIFGDINISIARELTKIHEQKIKTNIKEAILYFENKTPKGEFVILFNPKV